MTGRPARKAPAAALPAVLDEALAGRPLLVRASAEEEARLAGLEPAAWGAAAPAAGAIMARAPLIRSSTGTHG